MAQSACRHSGHTPASFRQNLVLESSLPLQVSKGPIVTLIPTPPSLLLQRLYSVINDSDLPNIIFNLIDTVCTFQIQIDSLLIPEWDCKPHNLIFTIRLDTVKTKSSALNSSAMAMEEAWYFYGSQCMYRPCCPPRVKGYPMETL